MLVLLSL